MGNSNISLKPVNELLGMNFYIPAYQRGYRWNPQQALDLLNDIMSFANKSSSASEIYCIQPLVVQQHRNDNIMSQIKAAESIQQVEKLLKGSWDVVDGQQRLTTIFLIIKCLCGSNPYSIEYETRKDSKDYLDNPSGPDKSLKDTNIDFFHIFNIWSTISNWLGERTEEDKLKFKTALYEKVCFIWYQISNDEIAISVFTRLNVGKIPLTDSELIKALFLNRSNFDKTTINLEAQQHEIAMQWDQIEYALQNDEFWLFLHDKEYDKPTRIDYILDLICERDRLKLRHETKWKKGDNKRRLEEYNRKLNERIGNDEHKTFRYFYEGFCVQFAEYVGDEKDNWLLKVWGKIHDIYLTFEEWYRDYKLYHYIGYLVTVKNDKDLMENLLTMWEEKTKKGFLGSVDDCSSVKGMIKSELLKIEGFSDLENFKYDEEVSGKKVDKAKCKPILLLHNVETIIQQNERLVHEKKYSLPAFSRFPFHLYKRESWDVEHIRPNAGDAITDEKTIKFFLTLTKKYCQDMDLSNKIDEYLSNGIESKSFEELYLFIYSSGGALPDSEKNKIWNYTLLDRKTNQEYQNFIFPIKRSFIIEKEKGFKLRYSLSDDGTTIKKESIMSSEIAFVPPCTKNIFTKAYTDVPSTMTSWTIEDAKSYLIDMKNKLAEYLA